MPTSFCPDCGARVLENEVCACVLNRRPCAAGIVLGAACVLIVWCLVTLV